MKGDVHVENNLRFSIGFESSATEGATLCLWHRSLFTLAEPDLAGFLHDVAYQFIFYALPYRFMISSMSLYLFLQTWNVCSAHETWELPSA